MNHHPLPEFVPRALWGELNLPEVEIEIPPARNNENSKIENYYGHSTSFDAMVEAIKDKQVIGPKGEEISQEEAMNSKGYVFFYKRL